MVWADLSYSWSTSLPIEPVPPVHQCVVRFNKARVCMQDTFTVRPSPNSKWNEVAQQLFPYLQPEMGTVPLLLHSVVGIVWASGQNSCMLNACKYVDLLK